MNNNFSRNFFSKNFAALKRLVLYKPPPDAPQFVLDERGATGPEKAEKDGKAAASEEFHLAAQRHAAMLRYARRLEFALAKAASLLIPPISREKAAALGTELAALEKQKEQLSPLVTSYAFRRDPLDAPISASLEENKLALERLYNLPANKDLITRDITIPAAPPVKAFLAFIDGLADKQTINLAILQPLLLLGSGSRQLYDGDTLQKLVGEFLPANQVRLAHTLRDVTDSINLGDTAIFLDGAAAAIVAETKGFEHRTVSRSMIEQSVRSSQSAFTETIRVNTALVRTFLRASDLTAEFLTVGARGNNLCAIMYLKSVINPLLVEEARRRLKSIKTDTIFESGMLQHFFEDYALLPYPQSLLTERPDRVAAALSEGRLAILVDGSPFALVAPISLFTLLHASEDFSFSWITGSFSRALRIASTMVAALFPSLYIAISYFHQEALPTELILAVAGARENVPFPSIVEIAIMEFAFELIREAGVRIPNMMGSTIGIVGAIILGQAAVAASIVSPITVVIIAITGLSSFAIPDYSLAAAVRLTRFAFEIIAAILGLVGVASGILSLLVTFAAMKSLGVPYLAPVAPKTIFGYDVLLRGPAYSQEFRPDALSPQDRRRQPRISRVWTKTPAADKDKEDGQS